MTLCKFAFCDVISPFIDSVIHLKLNVKSGWSVWKQIFFSSQISPALVQSLGTLCLSKQASVQISNRERKCVLWMVVKRILITCTFLPITDFVTICFLTRDYEALNPWTPLLPKMWSWKVCQKMFITLATISGRNLPYRRLLIAPKTTYPRLAVHGTSSERGETAFKLFQNRKICLRTYLWFCPMLKWNGWHVAR